MSLFEFDETAYQNLFERKGHEKGLEQGRIEAVVSLLKYGVNESSIREDYPNEFDEGKAIYLKSLSTTAQ